ncbi:FkbM family methyltransferase [Antricoccus suffuscus]|uniref:FkbM family methyltransferase n=1 Tax=Antricoccus suffuscus TaxID=1629062 RepID=A0A2T1A6X9_9ACTN|nr:FkbM family methyltransferase [Antricoccus suffuscus]
MPQVDLTNAQQLNRMLARLYDQQLRDHVSTFSNMHQGRSNSARHLDDLFFRLVELSEPTVFAEAGAYKAEASRQIKRMLPQCRVVAFEANKYNFIAYSGLLKESAPGVEYLNCAVTDQPGEETFHLRRQADGQDMRQVTGNSSLLVRSDESTTYEKFTVDAVSLDSYFPEVERSCIWIDVEGASKQVLKGARHFLSSCQVIKIEVEERMMWADQWLSLDVIAFMLAEGFVPIARDIEYENQFNIVFVENEFGRRPEVLAATEYHGNYMAHHLASDRLDQAEQSDEPPPRSDDGGSISDIGAGRPLTAARSLLASVRTQLVRRARPR